MIEENGHYYERCHDCGGAVKDVKHPTHVCNECWERREWLVKEGKHLYSDPRFKKIQKAMANQTGTAKKQIIAWLKEIDVKV